MPTRRHLRSATACLALAIVASGCGSKKHAQTSDLTSDVAAGVTPNVALPAAAGHQQSGAFGNDLVSGEATAAGTSSSGIYVVRHGFSIPDTRNAPSATN